jgi:hypothetical protein
MIVHQQDLPRIVCSESDRWLQWSPYVRHTTSQSMERVWCCLTPSRSRVLVLLVCICLYCHYRHFPVMGMASDFFPICPSCTRELDHHFLVSLPSCTFTCVQKLFRLTDTLTFYKKTRGHSFWVDFFRSTIFTDTTFLFTKKKQYFLGIFCTLSGYVFQVFHRIGNQF